MTTADQLIQQQQSQNGSSAVGGAEPLERFLMLYCFPVQLLVGLTGNGLNLLVLTNRRMRSGTNWLLAMVALADSLFLLAFLPHTLRFHHWVREQLAWRQFILYANSHITAFVNACAFASAWLVVAVSLERMSAIRWPLRARRLWSCANLCRLVLAIWGFALLVSGYSHFTYSIQLRSRNETSVHPESGQLEVKQRWSGQSIIRPGWERLWGWLTAGSVLFGVLLPVLLVLLANLAILEALERERRGHRGKTSRPKISGSHSGGSSGRSESRRSSPGIPAMAAADGTASPSSLLPRPSSAQLRHQRRATLAVLVIACTFTLCQTPSALVILWEVCWPPVGQLASFRTAAVLSNFLVVTGKTANHFLLCLWSAHFRQMAALVLGQLLPEWARFGCFNVQPKSPRPPSLERPKPKQRTSLKQPSLPQSLLIRVEENSAIIGRNNGSLPLLKASGETEQLEANGQRKSRNHLTVAKLPLNGCALVEGNFCAL